MEEKEIWKVIPDFPDYEISTLGNIYSKLSHCMMTPQRDNNGYLRVRLFDGQQKHTVKVHRLVAKTFLPNPNEYLEVNHVDGNKCNNNIKNLQWCTRSENIKHAYDTGLRYPSKKAGKKVRIIETGRIYDSINECAEDIDGLRQHIGECIAGDRKTHKGYHFEQVIDMQKTTFLYDYQLDAVNRMHNGSILCGSVGSGKSRTSLFWYFKECGGWIDKENYTTMTKPRDLYIITTAKKVKSLEWQEELVPFLLLPNDDGYTRFGTKVVINSWNQIGKYVDVKDSIFILDEQRLVSYGSWTKSFLKIAKHNKWVLLSATPGDSYLEYLPVFIANGFFKNKTEFNREHVYFSRYTKYPKIEGYHDTQRLDRLRDRILVTMDYKHDINPIHTDVYCNYDTTLYKNTIRNRWDYFKDEPLSQASSLCYALRKIVNIDESRQVKLLEILENHPRVIIFYNFTYELEILRNLAYGEGVEVAEYNGQKHQDIPTGEKWVYLCQYTAACEGWSCIRTNCIVFYSQNYSYKVMTQAAGRIDRLTTSYKDLFYYHLKSRSGIDLAITKALNNKKRFNERKFAGWDK